MRISKQGIFTRLPEQLLFLIPLLFVSNAMYSQGHITYETIDAIGRKNFFERTKPGNSVYVASDNPPLAIHAARELKETCNWRVVSQVDSADFILYIEDSRLGVSEMAAYAVYIDPESREPFYQTHPVNTLGRISFHAKKGVVKKLIERRIVFRTDELDERDYINVYRCKKNLDMTYHMKRDCMKIKDCDKIQELTYKSAMYRYNKCTHCFEKENNAKYKNL